MLNPYYDDWLKVELDTKVKDVIEEDGKYYTALEETIYYHESGGQHSDKGTINNHQILGSKYIDKTLYHLLDAKLEGDVKVLIDKKDRIIRSQIHTAQHVMCSYINKHYNAKTVAFFNDDIEAGAEMAFEEINDDILKDIEETVNNYILKDCQVEIIYPTKEEVVGLVKDEKLDHDELRAVRIGDVDYDMCACVHVPSLRYLQMFKIERYEKTTRGYRIYFLVGEQLRNTYTKQYDVLRKASAKSATPIYEIDLAIDKLNNDLKDVRSKYDELNNNYLNLLAEKYINSDQDVLIEVFEEFDTKSLSKLASIINNHIEKKIFFIATFGDKMHLIITHHKNIEMNSRAIFKELASEYNLKGGGNPFMAQGGGLKNLEIIKNIENIAK